VLPNRIANWSLTSLQQRLVKTGGRLVRHARYFWLLLAEGHLTRRLFGSILRRIAALPVPAWLLDGENLVEKGGTDDFSGMAAQRSTAIDIELVTTFSG